MNASVAARLSIRASPAEIFVYFREVKLHHIWNPRVQSVKPLSKLKLGSVYKSESILLGIKTNASNTVTRYIKDQEIEIKIDIGILHYVANYRLVPVGHKTLVICKTEVSSDKDAFKLAKPMLKLLAKREIQTDLHLLRLAVEEKIKA